MSIWDDTELQAIRLASEMIMTQDLDMDTLCESMDLDMEELNELMDRVQEKWEELKLQAAPIDDPPEIQLTFEEEDEMEERREEFDRQNENLD